MDCVIKKNGSFFLASCILYLSKSFLPNWTSKELTPYICQPIFTQNKAFPSNKSDAPRKLISLSIILKGWHFHALDKFDLLFKKVKLVESCINIYTSKQVDLSGEYWTNQHLLWSWVWKPFWVNHAFMVTQNWHKYAYLNGYCHPAKLEKVSFKQSLGKSNI